jgi:hypothetical protein
MVEMANIIFYSENLEVKTYIGNLILDVMIVLKRVFKE